MITAAITAAVGAILSLFGVKPGKYLIGVAVVVKGIIVVLGLLAASRVARRLREKQAAAQSSAPPDSPSPDSPPRDSNSNAP